MWKHSEEILENCKLELLFKAFAEPSIIKSEDGRFFLYVKIVLLKKQLRNQIRGSHGAKTGRSHRLEDSGHENRRWKIDKKRPEQLWRGDRQVILRVFV